MNKYIIRKKIKEREPIKDEQGQINNSYWRWICYFVYDANESRADSWDAGFKGGFIVRELGNRKYRIYHNQGTENLGRPYEVGYNIIDYNNLNQVCEVAELYASNYANDLLKKEVSDKTEKHKKRNLDTVTSE